MNYGQRLVVAAKHVLSGNTVGGGGDSPEHFHELGVTATLKPHQIEGVSWLIRRYMAGVNVILVILCPLSVVDSWVSEMTIFAPKLRVLSYVAGKEQRRSMRRIAQKHVQMQPLLPNFCDIDVPEKLSFLPFDVLLTTYDIALADQDFLSQIPWRYAVIDEAQRLKNPSTVFYNVLHEKFVIPRRLLITGTPIQNNLSELWALLHFCMPSVFGTLKQFLFTFNEVADPPSGQVAPKVRQQFGILKYILEAFMLRRTKSQLIECGTLILPPLTEISVMVPLSSLQNKVYASILRNELPQLLALVSGGSNNHSLQNIVMQLRKACSHPYLFPGIEPEPYKEGEHLIQASGKLIVLDKLLQKLQNSGHRVLLFAQMTSTLDIIQDFMELRKYSYERLDGSIRAEERFAAIRSFSRHFSDGDSNSTGDSHSAFVFLISTRAGGVGLNLVAADTVIFYEQDWNPQVDKQALQRAHRIGQMNHVLSINLVSEHSVEEVIMRRAEKKLQLSKNVVGEDGMNQNANDMEGTDGGIFRSIVFGLHTFDPSKVDDAKSAEQSLLELDAIAEKVIAIRHHQQTDKDERSFEVRPMNYLNGFDRVTKKYSDSLKLEPEIDEASYLSWVKEFEVTKQDHDPLLWSSCEKILPARKHVKNDATMGEEKKLAKWEASGYHSFSVSNPSYTINHGMVSDSGSVNFVYGDCTQPSKVCPSEPTFIMSCVDDSGKWGRGGMFDALAKVSPSVPAAYERASEFKDLHLGDLHLINITEDCNVEGRDGDFAQFVALAVVQSYNARRKIPRSKISISDLECCLSKASFSAAQKSASIHMPRIGYQEGSDRSEWYTVERLIRKYASFYAVNIFVYYFRRL